MKTLKILGAGPVKRGVTRLATEFEKRTGHKVSVEFTGAPAVSQGVLAGEAVDVAVVPQSAMGEFEKQGRIAAGSRGLVGRSRIGLVGRKGVEGAYGEAADLLVPGDCSARKARRGRRFSRWIA